MNPAATKGSKRETQSLTCCGRIYRRWRFTGKTFSRSFQKKCVICGEYLRWPTKYTPIDIGEKQRLKMQDKVIRFRLQGLNSLGRPYGRPHYATREELREAWNRRQLARYYKRKSIYIAQGLTAHGKPRVLHTGPYSPLFLAYKQFMNEGKI